MERQGTQQIKDVMTRDVETISADATLQEAAKKMAAADVGPLPVVDGGRVVGMCTDRDIIGWAAGAGGSTGTTKVRDIMTTQVDSCLEDDDAREVARSMQAKQHKRLVVLDRNQQLAGIVSLADLPVSGV